MRLDSNKTDCTAHLAGSFAWQGAGTQRVGSMRIRSRQRVSVRALWRETAPPD